MIYTSIYDSSITVDTETREINGSRIINDLLESDGKLYEYTEANREKLLATGGYGEVYETENGRLYEINGARWTQMFDVTWMKNNKEV